MSSLFCVPSTPGQLGEKPAFFSWKVTLRGAWELGPSDLRSGSHFAPYWFCQHGQISLNLWTLISPFAKYQKQHVSWRWLGETVWRVVRSVAAEAWLSVRFRLCSFLVVHSWTSSVNSLCLSYHIYEMSITVGPTS